MLFSSPKSFWSQQSQRKLILTLSLCLLVAAEEKKVVEKHRSSPTPKCTQKTNIHTAAQIIHKKIRPTCPCLNLQVSSLVIGKILHFFLPSNIKQGFNHLISPFAPIRIEAEDKYFHPSVYEHFFSVS